MNNRGIFAKSDTSFYHGIYYAKNYLVTVLRVRLNPCLCSAVKVIVSTDHPVTPDAHSLAHLYFNPQKNSSSGHTTDGHADSHSADSHANSRITHTNPSANRYPNTSTCSNRYAVTTDCDGTCACSCHGPTKSSTDQTTCANESTCATCTCGRGAWSFG